MPTNTVLDKIAARATFTITLDSLANGSARQSTMISNASPAHPRALIWLILESNGSAPTAGAVYEVYLLRSNGTEADDNAGASDAAITIENAPLLGTIVVTATANKNFYGCFDTAALGPLGTSWGIAVKNSSGQALHAATSTNVAAYMYVDPDIAASA